VRVQEWRAANPGYGRGRPRRSLALQDPLVEQVVDSNEETAHFRTAEGQEALQDLLGNQLVVLIGLIAHFTDSTLQDSIADTIRRLGSLGADILASGGSHARQTSVAPRAPPS